MKSMTGYGRCRESRGDCIIICELRAVNHRFFDCTVKAPRQYGFLEDAVKRAASERIARGKVEIYIALEQQTAADVAVTVNHAMAAHYLAAFRALSEQHGLPCNISAEQLAQMPEVLLQERVEQDAEAITREVLCVLSSAIDAFDVMREREGEKLRQDVVQRCGAIETLVGEVEKRSPERVAQYRERLLARMREVLEDATIDETRIVQEAALFADKTAVDEETVRLRSHLHQMSLMLEESEAVGRKLDFLVQEMNRETNTIGSKANDTSLSRTVVDIKSEIEKIREQIQNIE